jgi:hypothetical protein
LGDGDFRLVCFETKTAAAEVFARWVVAVFQRQGEAMNYYTLPNFNGDDYDEDDRAPMTADQQASHNQRMVEETAIIQQSPVEVAGLTW